MLTCVNTHQRLEKYLSTSVWKLGTPRHVPPPPLIPLWHRNGPSRVRRQQKREEARKLFAEEARKELSAEEAEVIEHAEKAENGKAADLNQDPKEIVKQ